MNGPDHYRVAEKCLRRSESSDPQGADLLVKQAQVHADLAHVAAVIDAGNHVGYDGGDHVSREVQNSLEWTRATQ